MSQYPKIKFEQNIPVVLTFKFGDAKFSDGQMPDGRQFSPSYAHRCSVVTSNMQGLSLIHI